MGILPILPQRKSDTVVYPRPVYYLNKEAKDKVLDNVKAQEHSSPANLETALKNYTIPDTLLTAASGLKSMPGTIFVIRNPVDNHTQRLQKQLDGERQE